METFKKYLPDTPLYESNDFIIYGNDEIFPYIENLVEKLVNEKRRLMLFLGISEFDQIPINLFNSHEDYLEFTKQFYEPSPYSIGNFTNGMINYYYDLKRIKGLHHSIRHELTHLLYQRIWDGKYNRVVWLDEGLAQNFSDEKDLLKLKPYRFKNWYLDRILRRDKEIPPIDFLEEHGDTYGKFEDMETKRYSGYDLSYLIVRYLLENYSYEELQSILNNIEKIEELKTHIIHDVISYYNNKFNVSSIKDNILDIKTPNELMDYMNMFIIYGWVDKKGEEHINNLKGLRELYRVNSLEDTITRKIGTCIEQAKLIKFVLDRLGLETKLYCNRKYETEELTDDDIKMHCFVAFKYNSKWYHFEHSNSQKRGIHEYETLDELLLKAIGPNTDDDIRVLTEISDLPDGLTFKELNEYINSFEPIINLETKKELN